MRRLLRALLSLVLGLIIAWGGVWTYKTMTATDPLDQVWLTVNVFLPTPLRTWSCSKVRANAVAKGVKVEGLAPMGCEHVWK